MKAIELKNRERQCLTRQTTKGNKRYKRAKKSKEWRCAKDKDKRVQNKFRG